MLGDPKHKIAEAQDVLNILLSAFEEEKDSTIRELRGDEAQQAVDIMQEVSALGRQCIQATHKSVGLDWYEGQLLANGSYRSPQCVEAVKAEITWIIPQIRKDPRLLPPSERRVPYAANLRCWRVCRCIPRDL